MKKIVSLFLSFVIIINIVPVQSAFADYTLPSEVTANAVYMENLDTGIVVYDKNSTKKIYPASVTKIMTCILALEYIDNLDTEIITVEPYMLEEFMNLPYSYSNAGLRNYEEFKAIDLLYALMLPSASDAANTLAAHVGDGSIDRFIDMMNEKAAELGMKDTHFTNPHGLHNPEHYTTAYDLSLLTKYAIKNEKFMDIVETSTYSFTTNKRPQTQYITTTNFLQDNARYPNLYLDYIQGVKTGTTDEAGSCLVSTATKNGYTYLLVLMGAPYEDAEGNSVKGNFQQTTMFYEWVFKNFKLQTLIDKDVENYITEVPLELCWGKDTLRLTTSESFEYLVPSNYEASNADKIFHLPESINAPIEKGTIIGTMDITLSGEVIGTINLLAGESVERSMPLYVLAIIKMGIGSVWFKIGAISIVLFFIFLFISAIIIRRKNKMYKKSMKSGKRKGPKYR